MHALKETLFDKVRALFDNPGPGAGLSTVPHAVAQGRWRNVFNSAVQFLARSAGQNAWDRGELQGPLRELYMDIHSQIGAEVCADSSSYFPCAQYVTCC